MTEDLGDRASSHLRGIFPGVRIFLLLLLSPLPSATPVMAQNSDGEKAFETGDYAKAAALFRSQIESGSAPSRTFLLFGTALYELGRAQESQEAIRLYLEREPRDPVGWTQLGIGHFALNQLQPAVSALRHSLGLSPDQPRVEKILGRCYVVSGQQADAERAFARALALEPEDFETHYLLGRLYQTVGRLQEAVTQFEQSLRIKPGNARAEAFLGSVYYGLGQMEQAESSFRDSILSNARSSKPDHVPSLEYGIFLQRTGKLEESVGQLIAAVDQDPGNLECRFQLGRSLYRLGRLEPAREVLEKAVAIEPGDPGPYYLLGRVCYELGDRACGDQNTRRSEELRIKHSESYAKP